MKTILEALRQLNKLDKESLNEGLNKAQKELIKIIKNNLKEDPECYEDYENDINDICYNEWINSDIYIPGDFLEDPENATDEEVDKYYDFEINTKEFKDQVAKLFK